MNAVEVTIHYLQMLAPSHRHVPAPRSGLAIMHVEAPTVPYYRALYDGVGRDFHWVDRRKMSDEALGAILADPRNELHVLQVDGATAGFVELDRRQQGEIELAYFGLLPDYVGQGLGKWLLQWALDKAWSYQPQRLWVHTCTLDHPAALPNYQQAGFVLYEQETIRQEL